MRAREFIIEQRGKLPDEIISPMQNTYIIPGLTSQDPYRTYRFGVAIARARAQEEFDQNVPVFQEEGAFGEHAVVVPFNAQEKDIIDKAITMIGLSGGAKLVSSLSSQEPLNTNVASPIKSFKGYPR